MKEFKFSEHLASAVWLYVQEPTEKTRFSYPISKIDAMIIVQLIKIVELKGLSTLKAVLEQWKAVPDQDVYDALLQLKDQEERPSPFDDENPYETHKKLPDNWIVIKSKQIKIRYIYSIDCCVEYDSKIEMYRPAIKINETDNNQMLYANTCFTFTTEEERDEELERINAILTDLGHKLY